MLARVMVDVVAVVVMVVAVAGGDGFDNGGGGGGGDEGGGDEYIDGGDDDGGDDDDDGDVHDDRHHDNATTTAMTTTRTNARRHPQSPRAENVRMDRTRRAGEGGRSTSRYAVFPPSYMHTVLHATLGINVNIHTASYRSSRFLTERGLTIMPIGDLPQT